MKKFLVVFYKRDTEPVEIEAESVEFVDGCPSRYVFYGTIPYKAECPKCGNYFSKQVELKKAIFNADGVLYIEEI